jgi:hypothetical protein
MKWTHYRAQVAALSRDRSANDPDLLGARRNLVTERLANEIQSSCEKAPPLLPEQRRRLISLFLSPASEQS